MPVQESFVSANPKWRLVSAGVMLALHIVEQRGLSEVIARLQRLLRYVADAVVENLRGNRRLAHQYQWVVGPSPWHDRPLLHLVTKPHLPEWRLALSSLALPCGRLKSDEKSSGPPRYCFWNIRCRGHRNRVSSIRDALRRLGHTHVTRSVGDDFVKAVYSVPRLRSLLNVSKS